MSDVQAETFIKQCRKTALDAHLQVNDWQLGLCETADINGPIIYFKDFDTGYTQLVTLLPEVFDEERIADENLNQVVNTIGALHKSLTQQIELAIKNQEEKFAHLLSSYAINTKTAAIARKKLGDTFSLFIIGRTCNDGGYELRPFATGHKTIQKVEIIEQTFDAALKTIKKKTS